jgi:O-antigen biosynthesis protein
MLPVPRQEIDQLRPSVTVVICTHNRPSQLERCLQALQAIDYSHYSTVVVDSASNSDAAKAIVSRYGSEYVISPFKGVSRARNVGTRQARNDIVAYLDDDMVPHSGWLSSLVDEFVDNRVMAVTGPVLPLNLRASGEAELGLALNISHWGPRRFQIDRFSPKWFERANFGGLGDGNFAIRRSAYDRLPSFDERLGRGATISGGEEHYAYYSLLEIGFKIAYAPLAVVFHPSSPRSQEYRRQLFADAVAYAAFLIYRHPSQFTRVIKYCIEGCFRRKRPWRYLENCDSAQFSRYYMFLSTLKGLSSFYRSIRITSREVPDCKERGVIDRDYHRHAGKLGF